MGIDPTTGVIALSQYEQDIKESIRIILATRKGERAMRADFGCGIHEYVFASINTGTIGLIETSVREAMLVYEPRIEVIEVDVNTEEAANGLLKIKLDYRLRDTNKRENLVYSFYISEGNPVP